jgi:hypothetical protein
LYLWTGSAYSFVSDLSGTLGFTGSAGTNGFTGSQGTTGFTGSAGTNGFTGSQGDIGYTGSKGDTGFTGSASTVVGYTGSQGDIGYTGSAATTGNITFSTNTISSSSGGNTNITIDPPGTGTVDVNTSRIVNVTDPSNAQDAATKNYVDTAVSGAGGGTSWQAIKTSAFNATAGEGYFVNTNAGAITATLPASPTLGDEIVFIDYRGSFDTNNLTVARNGNPIQGSATDLTVSTERAGFTLVFVDGIQGWLLKDK